MSLHHHSRSDGCYQRALHTLGDHDHEGGRGVARRRGGLPVRPPKALVTLDGQTLAERGTGLLRAGGADPVLIVAGAAPVEVDHVHTVYNPDWRTGMGSSLRAALRALAGADAGARP